MNAWRPAQNSRAFMGCGVPWLFASYLPEPRPLRVRNQATEGRFSGFSPRAASSTARVTGAHCMPSGVPVTRQSYALNQVSGVPGTTETWFGAYDWRVTGTPEGMQWATVARAVLE